MTQQIIDEVTDLHVFFESWLTGSVEQSKEQYARFENVIADDFIMVPPGSNVLPRDTVLEIFWQQHGSITPPFRIEIRNPVSRKVAESLYIVTYEEWQFGSEQTSRITTALMSENETGIKWLSVHESWFSEN